MLEARRLLHGTVIADAEHLAVFGDQDDVTGVVTGGLVPDASLTYASISSGNWSAAGTWGHLQSNGVFRSDGTIPGLGDNVLVSTGTAVTVDKVFTTQIDAQGNAQRSALHTIRVDGTLQFAANVNTALLVDTIIVEPHGTFQMGTAAQPIAANVQASVIFATGAIDLSWDPLAFSKGLVSHGTVSIYGSTVTNFEQATAGVSAGATSLVLGATPTGWKAGDNVVVTGDTATNASNLNQDETLQIASISGRLVTFTTRFQYNHSLGSVFVCDTTRNATFSSENTVDISQRGHVMFMHNANVHVVGAGFYGLGRTDKSKPIDDPVLVSDPDHPGQMTYDVISPTLDPLHPELGHRILVPVLGAQGKPVLNPDGTPKMQIARTGTNPRGRYAVHVHRTGTGPASGLVVIDDNAVVGSPGWGIVNHSGNVDVSNNVVFNVTGAAYVTEAGDETGDFVHNIAIHSQGTKFGTDDPTRRAVQDFGHEGVGFWLQGGNVSLIDNVAAGQRDAGYFFFPVGLNQSGLGVTTISGADLSQYPWAKPGSSYAVGDVPLKQFVNNVAFASGGGLETWFSQVNVSANRNSRSVIQNFSAWNLTPGGTAIFAPYTNLMTFQNVTLTGSLANPSGTGFDGNIDTANLIFHDVSMAGFNVGISAPADGGTLIEGGAFNNLTNILVAANFVSVHGLRVVNINDLPGDPVQFTNSLKDGSGKPRPQLNIVLQSNFNPFAADLSLILNLNQSSMGRVFRNGVEIYYAEQAANFVPFNTASSKGVAANVPQQLRNKTNQQLWTTYGLAVGGTVAPSAATASDPKITGLLGPAAANLPVVLRTSGKFVNGNLAPYLLTYQVPDPNQQLPNGTVQGSKYAHYAGTAFVSEKTATILHAGWNLITRNILGQVQTFLVYDDIAAPTFQLTSVTPKVIHQADIDAGATVVVQGIVADDYSGISKYRLVVRLDDPTYIGPVHSKIDPATGKIINVVTLTLQFLDNVRNVTTVNIDLTVT